MRYEGIPDAYEQLRDLSRGTSITKDEYIVFVKSLNITSDSKEKLLKLSPYSYTGIATFLAKS